MKNRIKEARKYAQSFKSDFTKEDDIVLFFERIEAFLAGVESATPMIEPTNIIFEAIEKTIGVSKDEITSTGKRRRFCYTRVIYSHLRFVKASDAKIAEELKKHRTTILYYLQRFYDLIDYVPEFRTMFLEVKKALKE